MRALIYYTTNRALTHHGIKGQKWGDRHGPPYPLNAGSHSASEKKAGTKGWTKEAKGEQKSSSRKFKSSSAVGGGPAKSEKVSNYRSKMINRYAKSNPAKAKEYENISDEELAIEYQRRKNMQKAVLGTVAIVGVSAACFLALRNGTAEQITKNSSPEQVKDALKKSLEDLDYVIHDGTTMHRMVPFENFNLDETKGKATYVTVKDHDKLAYMAFLKDFSGTGKRYDVSLKATKDIIAPADEKAKQIFDELWQSDPSYKEALVDTITKMKLRSPYINATGEEAIKRLKEKVEKEVEANPFKQGITAIAGQQEDAKKLIDAYKSHGYNALVDYHDKGGVSELPIILFDALNDTIKTGEEFVTQDMKIAAVKELAETQGQPLQEVAKWVASLPLSEMLKQIT